MKAYARSSTPYRTHAVAVLSLALLCACGTPPTPQASIRAETRNVFSLRQEPHRAAVCIAGNVDRYRSPYSAQIRPGTAPAIVEVHVRGAEIVAIAKLLVAGDASTAEIWMTPQPLYDRDALVAAMIAGC